MNLKEAIKKRRSVYDLDKNVKVSDKEIKEMIELALDYVPSSFDSRSTRIVLLLGKNHEEFWNIVKSTLTKIVSTEAFKGTEQKIDNCFAAGYGTVLFFEDQDVIHAMQKAFPTYEAAFPVYSEHTSGMHQYVIWTLFAAAGLGATNQHYQPLIDNEVAARWNIPDSWKLVSQMPFGNIAKAPAPKKLGDMDKVFKVFE